MNENIDVEKEMLDLFWIESNKSKEEHYSDIKRILNIDSFMKATNNNLDMLFKYMYSPTEGISLSNVEVGQFIKEEYNDDFYYRREVIRCEEIERFNKINSKNL